MTKFNSMPNFRQLINKKLKQDEDNNRQKKLIIYRSSRPDFLTLDEIEEFKQLNIQSILDFRSMMEYRKSIGSKYIDEIYPIYKVKYPTSMKYKPGDQVTFFYKQTTKKKPVEINPVYKTNTEDFNKKHFLIDFFNLGYIWTVFNRAPLWLKLYSLLCLLFDLIFFTGYKHFVRAFATNVLNEQGLIGQYCDMVEHGQAAIYSALKVLYDANNLPAMINCAHGKDRTGVISAIILSCLGESEDYIINNYAESTNELNGIRHQLEKDIVGRFHLCPTFVSSDKQTMQDLLHYISKKYGCVSNYLESIGFTKGDQELLKKNLLA